jgi:hypothetical protein
MSHIYEFPGLEDEDRTRYQLVTRRAGACSWERWRFGRAVMGLVIRRLG